MLNGVRSYRQGHPVVTREAIGSSPIAPATYCPLAQLVEQVTVNHLVRGSSPRGAAIYLKKEKCNGIKISTSESVYQAS